MRENTTIEIHEALSQGRTEIIETVVLASFSIAMGLVRYLVSLGVKYIVIRAPQSLSKSDVAELNAIGAVRL